MTESREDRRRVVHLENSLWRRVRGAAEADGRSITNYIDRALTAHLDREGIPAPPGTPKGMDPLPMESTNDQ